MRGSESSSKISLGGPEMSGGPRSASLGEERLLTVLANPERLGALRSVGKYFSGRRGAGGGAGGEAGRDLRAAASPHSAALIRSSLNGGLPGRTLNRAQRPLQGAWFLPLVRTQVPPAPGAWGLSRGRAPHPPRWVPAAAQVSGVGLRARQ